MGFQRSILKLKFVDEFEGLEIRMRRTSVGELGKIISLNSIDADALTEENAVEHFNSICEKIHSGLISWNYEDDKGEPVPSTLEGVSSCDLPMLMTILDAWMDASTNVSQATEKKSQTGSGTNNGTQRELVEVNLPMETLPPMSQTN